MRNFNNDWITNPNFKQAVEDCKSQKRTCSKCNIEKKFIFSHKVVWPAKRIFLDEKGRQWSGRVCPPCQSARVSKKLKTPPDTEIGE